MTRMIQAAFALVLAAVAGCGSGGEALSPTNAEDTTHRNTMAQLGELLNLQKADTGKPPTKVADLKKYETAFTEGYQKVNDGEVVVLWGAPIEAGASDKVLAYEKQTPQSGGFVLMQDGLTVKKLDADTFKSASKAPGTPSADHPSDKAPGTPTADHPSDKVD